MRPWGHRASRSQGLRVSEPQGLRITGLGVTGGREALGSWGLEVTGPQGHGFTVTRPQDQRALGSQGLRAVYSEYLDIRIYSNILFRIYSYSKIFVSFLPGEYIWIFVWATFCLMNIFGYSFVEVSHNKYFRTDNC